MHMYDVFCDSGFREKQNHQTETQRKMFLLRARPGRSRLEKLLRQRKLITDDVQNIEDVLNIDCDQFTGAQQLFRLASAWARTQ